MQVVAQIQSIAPQIDSDILEYLSAYFDDPSNDFQTETLAQFVSPFLEAFGANTQRIQRLCQQLSKHFHNPDAVQDDHQPTILEAPVHMNANEAKVMEFDRQTVGDISHTMNRNVQKSTVDQTKLREAEARLKKKREKRGRDNELWSPIPVWNPDVVPPIIVNQAKQTGSSESRSKDIKIEDFDISYGGKTILTDATLSLAYGRHYGLVGKNGVGKSTLLRAIASGELAISKHIRILHVEQEITGDDTEALTAVMQADTERESLLAEEKKLNKIVNTASSTPDEVGHASQRLREIYTRLQEIDSDSAESRASSILAGLGFSPEQQRAATRTFSGGWRMRIALARALFCNPDLLLADEVTNYLDFPAVVWLENYFQNWKSTLLVVSHDKSFLDSVSTDILHMHSGRLDHYHGNFGTFVNTRAERRKNQMREYESQLQYRQHLQAFIDKWRYNAARAAQAQSKIKILEKLPPLEAPPKEEMEGLGEGDSVFFRFEDPESLSPPVLQVDEVTFGYDKSRIILKNISFDVQMDSKVAIVGPNGAGKSTLVKLITDEVSPQSGLVHRHGRLRLGLFSQHHVDQLTLGISSIHFLQSKFPGMTEEDYRRILGRFGISGMTALQPIGTLSGGQKSRVAFAWLSMMQPHILVLDEPTNHLDMDSIDALASALRQFKGGVVIVSHDEAFLDSVCNEIWVCSQGGLTRFEGKPGCGDGVVKQYKKSLFNE